MILFLCILIVILIYYNYKESFTVKTVKSDNNNYKNVYETYNYPLCVTGMCTTSDAKLKPKFNYNLSNNRCVHNSSQKYDIPKSELDNWMYYKSEPNSIFTSCENTVNTIYPYVTGRYIRLLRLDSDPMKLKHISVYNINKENLSINKMIFVNPLFTDSSGNINYSDMILNSTDMTFTFQTGSPNPYIQIDLGNNMDICYIKISHGYISGNSALDSHTLGSAYLVIYEDNVNDNNDEFGKIKYFKQVGGADIDRMIYVYDLVPTSFPAGINLTMSVINSYTFPCSNCSDINNNLYKNHKYYDSNKSRCFKPNSLNINKSILESAMNNTLTNVSQYFNSCSTGFNTMVAYNYSYIYIPFSVDIADIVSNVQCDYQSVETPVPYPDNTANGLRNGKPSFRFGSDASVNGGYIKYNSPSFKINSNESFTIQFYVKLSNNNTWASIFSLNLYNDGILCRLRGNADNFYVNNSSINIIPYFSTLNKWYFVNIVRDLQQQRINFHVDGILVNYLYISNSSIINNAGGSLFIGASGHAPVTERINGWISDFIFIKGNTFYNKLIN
jgi:hypothetical protein